jgi:hypothetical protein
VAAGDGQADATPLQHLLLDCIRNLESEPEPLGCSAIQHSKLRGARVRLEVGLNPHVARHQHRPRHDDATTTAVGQAHVHREQRTLPTLPGTRCGVQYR